MGNPNMQYPTGTTGAPSAPSAPTVPPMETVTPEMAQNFLYGIVQRHAGMMGLKDYGVDWATSAQNQNMQKKYAKASAPYPNHQQFQDSSGNTMKYHNGRPFMLNPATGKWSPA